MQLTVKQSDLAKGLDIVSRAVSTKTTLDILKNILLSAEMNDDGAWQLRLSATNLEIGMTAIVPCRVDTEGATTVPARLFVDLVKSLPDDVIRLDYTEPNKTLNIISGRNKSKLKCIDAEDFPEVPTMPDDAVSLTADTVRPLIDFTAFAAATDESRYVLTSVVWTIKGDAEGRYHLTTAATDGFRLSVADTNSLPPTAPVKCLIPGKALIELGKLLKDDTAEVLFAATRDRNQVIFRVGNVTIVSQLIDGNYPMYEQIIPKSYSTLVAADRSMLQRVVKRASLFSRDGANIIRFKVEPPSAGMDFGVLHVTADSTAYGDTAGQVDVAIEGPATEIAFNAKYLSDALAAIKTEQVRIELLSAASPGVFKPSVGNFTHVVMPMHIGR